MSTARWVALATQARIGGRTMTNLLTQFHVLDNVFDAPPSDLRRDPLIGMKTAHAIRSIDLSQVEAELEQSKNYGIHMLTWLDQAYPNNLVLCADAPPVLFALGDLAAASERAIAIVGTRQPRPDSRRLAQEMAYELAKRNWCIVSGLAFGVDTAAHQGALEAKGRTAAVLGSGIQAIYPPQNELLARQIVEHGVLLSELHPQTVVSPQQLIARNRIQSGLSREVIVVQTGLNGGSMSTARRASEQGRAVFAVLGGDTGCDALLEEGAETIDPGGVDWDDLSARLGRRGATNAFLTVEARKLAR